MQSDFHPLLWSRITISNSEIIFKFSSKRGVRIWLFKEVVGSKVKIGDTLVILEAMKMEHQVKASEDGKVTKILIKKDDQLENGALLMVLDN